MERWQKQWIEKNKPILYEFVTVNTAVIICLESNSVLTSQDVMLLQGAKEKWRKINILFDTLMTRARGYSALIEAFSRTNQSLAEYILKEGKRQQESNGSNPGIDAAEFKNKLEKIRKHNDYIGKNLVSLLQTTAVNDNLMDILESKSVIGRYDIEALRAETENLERSNLLYEKIMTRIGGYEALLEALLQTNQMLAANILQKGNEDGGQEQVAELNTKATTNEYAERNLRKHEWCKKWMTQNQHALIGLTKVNLLLLAGLRERSILCQQDIDQIQAKTDESSKTHELFEILHCRTNSFDALLHALIQTNQTRAARIMENVVREFQQTECGSTDNFTKDDKSEAERLDKWLHDKVKQNLWKLLSATAVNSALLMFMEGKGVLCRADVDSIKSRKEELEKTKFLFDTLNTRFGGYDALLDALLQTGQPGAASILQDAKNEFYKKESK